MAAEPGLVCGQISTLNSTCVQCRLCHWSERHPNYTCLAKAYQPGLSSCRRPGICEHKARQRLHFYRRAAAKRQHRASSIDATQPRVRVIPNAPQKAKLGGSNNSVALPSSETGLFDNEKGDVLLVVCIAKDPFENKVSTELFRNARRPTEFFVVRVADRYLSVSALLQAAMIPARRCSHIFLSVEDVETLQRIGWYCATFYSV